MTTISVVMPVYNAAALLARSLAPLIAMLDRHEVDELLIVDDASTDGSIAIASRFPGVRIIRRTIRGGPGAARNDGSREAGGDYLWFVDADVIVADDAARLLQALLRETRPVAVFGSYDDAPGASNFLSQYKNLVHAYYHRRGRREASTFWAGCGAVDREAFAAIEGFDVTRYPEPSIEDIELGYRLRAAGGTIVSEPSLRGKHLKTWRLANLLHTDIFRRAIPWATLMLERGTLTDDLNVSRGERARALLAGASVLALIAAFTGWLPGWIAAALVATTIATNRALIGFFFARRGPAFAVGAFLFHQMQYLYSSAAFAFAYLSHRLRSRSP